MTTKSNMCYPQKVEVPTRIPPIAPQLYTQYRHPLENAWEMIEKVTRIAPGGNILDVGCGPGVQTKSMVEILHCNYLGIDIRQDMVDIAAQRMAGEPRVTFKVMNLLDTSTAMPRVFDLVVLCFVLHYLSRSEQYAMISKCVELLRPSGHLVIITMFMNDLIELWEYDYFPGLREIDTYRMPSSEAMHALICEKQFTLSEYKIHYMERNFDKKLIESIENKHYSGLRLLPEEDYKQGLHSMCAAIANGEKYTQSINCTLWIASKKQESINNRTLM